MASWMVKSGIRLIRKFGNSRLSDSSVEHSDYAVVKKSIAKDAKTAQSIKYQVSSIKYQVSSIKYQDPMAHHCKLLIANCNDWQKSLSTLSSFDFRLTP